MPLKRKIRNLPHVNDQVSFFDPVYQNDGDNESLADGIPRQSYRHESNETLDTDTIINSDQDQSSEMISTSKIVTRIKQIQSSIQQAQTMLESIDQLKNLVPDSDQQREKLCSIIENLEEQHTGYVNLLNLITLTADERTAIMNKNTTSHRQTRNDDDDLSLRRNIQSPVRPRIESKIGFTPQATMSISSKVPPIINSSDNEQTNRNDNSNYDSLVGSLKSDVINWKDQQSTSGDEASDIESEKEIERNLLLQKEQLRALQGQKRALLALKRRSGQQQLTSPKKLDEENDLLLDINNLRDRLKFLRDLYEQKYQVEIQQLKNSSKQPQILTENRLKNLEHVRERLDELEQIVTYYHSDLINQQDEETSIQPDNTQCLRSAIKQQTINKNNSPEQLDKLSSELTAKRLELEQAKSALNQLQQMVKQIQPDECSSSARSTPVQRKSSKTKSNDFELCTNQFIYTPQQPETNTSNSNGKTSLLSNILSPKPTTHLPAPPKNAYTGVKMASQHREIERLVESRQRLHTIKDQIAELHQSMSTPPETKTYQDNLNDPKNIRPSYKFNHQGSSTEDDDDSELVGFEYEGELDDDDDDDRKIQTNSSLLNQPRLKQSNFHTPEDIAAEQDNTNDLRSQIRDVCRCLSTFIEEQKSFNRHIEERFTAERNISTIDPVCNQLQQQVLTQGLIVNLNTAYREIAVLQSEINALQSENNRLTSSISFDNQYHHIPHSYSRNNSKESIYSVEQMKANSRPQPRPRFDEQNHYLPTKYKFEKSSKTSFNSQSTGQQTAIHIETTPIKHERNATFTAGHLSSPKPIHTRSKQTSDTYDLPNHYRHSSKENLSKSFVIRRRSITTENDNNHLYDYKQQPDPQSTIDDEQQSNDLSKTIDNIQPSAYYTSSTEDLDNIDIQALDLQVKSIMVQLIPFMRLHINEIFNQSVLNHIRERILFLFKQQADSAQLVRHFQNQFSELIGKTIEKYYGTTIRECAADLIRDISDVTFEELVKYKIYEDTNNNIEQKSEVLNKQHDEYSHLYNSSGEHYTQQAASIDDGETDIKYQIELVESENRPLTLIGSDEEDNDSDQEENRDNELETAVSRQETNLQQSESPVSTELNSNGHEYILVNPAVHHDNENEQNDKS